MKHRQTDRQTDRQTNRQTERQADNYYLSIPLFIAYVQVKRCHAFHCVSPDAPLYVVKGYL